MRKMVAGTSRRLAVVGAALLVLAGTLVAASAAAGPTNPGFETGDLSGWSANGNVAVVSGGAGAGTYYAELQSGSENPGVESTLSQTVTLAAGETVSGSANYIDADSCPYDDAWVDVDGSTVWSADCTTGPGWTNWSFVAPSSGSYTITAHIENTLDNDVSSIMGFDSTHSSASGPLHCWNPMGTDGCAQSARAAVCDKNGNFMNILETEKDSTDDRSPYFGATAAVYVEGFGLTCALSNVANAGLDPASFHDAGYRVDNTGTRAPAIVTDAQFGAWYEFFAKS